VAPGILATKKRSIAIKQRNSKPKLATTSLPSPGQVTMATNLASQLSQIAAHSADSLNLKAQRAAHSKSLIFEPRIAASQSFDNIYTICYEGFQELCLLDERFLEFQRNIFSERSQEEDRSQMTAEENSNLNKTIESFLGLVGGRLRLNPAVKAVEWLVRRFRYIYGATQIL
jgi:U3 small nucleolar RNA-associated protein 10